MPVSRENRSLASLNRERKLSTPKYPEPTLHELLSSIKKLMNPLNVNWSTVFIKPWSLFHKPLSEIRKLNSTSYFPSFNRKYEINAVALSLIWREANPDLNHSHIWTKLSSYLLYLVQIWKLGGNALSLKEVIKCLPKKEKKRKL